MSDFLLRYLLPAAVAGTIGTASVLLLTPFRKKLPVAAERAALVISALLFLLPFRLFSGLVIRAGAKAPTTGTKDAAQNQTIFYRLGESVAAALPEQPADAMEPDGGGAKAAAAAPTAAAPVSARAALLRLYAAVSAGLLFRGLLRYAVFRRKLTLSLVPLPGRQREIFVAVCREADIKNPPPVYQSASVSVPILAGCFSPIIVFPAEDTPEHVFRAAARHELEHISGWDIPLKVLIELVRSVHWWNPAVYLLRRRLTGVSELRCDERAAARLPEPMRIQYAEAILWFAGGAARMPAAGFAAGSKRKMMYRMERILRPTPPSRRVTSLITVLITLFLAAGMLAGCDAAGGADTPAPSAEPTPVKTAAPTAPPSSADSQNAADSEDDYPGVSMHNRPASGVFDLPGASGTVEGTPLTPFVFPVETYDSIGLGSGVSADGADFDHMAVDIVGETGAAILAADRGVVAAVGTDPARGNFLLLEHAGGIQTLYTHLHEIFVEEGDEIARGEQIAALGYTGQATGPHLHFEVIADGEQQRPEDYLEAYHFE